MKGAFSRFLKSSKRCAPYVAPIICFSGANTQTDYDSSLPPIISNFKQIPLHFQFIDSTPSQSIQEYLKYSNLSKNSKPELSCDIDTSGKGDTDANNVNTIPEGNDNSNDPNPDKDENNNKDDKNKKPTRKDKTVHDGDDEMDIIWDINPNPNPNPNPMDIISRVEQISKGVEEEDKLVREDYSDEYWEHRKENCGFCKFFLDSPCSSPFKAWSKCIDIEKKRAAPEDEEGYINKCMSHTRSLSECTAAPENAEYFEVFAKSMHPPPSESKDSDKVEDNETEEVIAVDTEAIHVTVQVDKESEAKTEGNIKSAST